MTYYYYNYKGEELTVKKIQEEGRPRVSMVGRRTELIWRTFLAPS